jgi:polyisoprenoid-binding protein YceI
MATLLIIKTKLFTMKTALFLLLTTLTGSTFAQTWNVQSDKAELKFHVVKEKVDGTIGGLKATIKFDPADPSKSSISGTVDVTTIDTKNKKRDDHLKAPEYFDAKKYPVISFKSSTITADNGVYKMTGTIKIKDVEKTIIWDFKFKDGVFSGNTSLNPKDFGVKMDSKVTMTVVIPVTK